MTTPNLVLKEALRIAELGYKVLPCSQDKEPILKGWPEKATTDAEKIVAPVPGSFGVDEEIQAATVCQFVAFCCSACVSYGRSC